jgi:hypothetical protein
LPPGLYRLKVEIDARSHMFEHLSAGTTDLVLQVPERKVPPAHVLRLRLRIAGSAGPPPAEVLEGLFAMDGEGDFHRLEREEGSEAWIVRITGRPPFDLFVHDRTTPFQPARWKPAALRALMPRTEPYDVTLEAGHTLRGRVLLNGRPVCASVTLEYSASRLSAPTFSGFGPVIMHTTCTDGEGNFALTALPSGEGRLTVQEDSTGLVPCGDRSGERAGEPRKVPRDVPRARQTVRLDGTEPLLIALALPGSRPLDLLWPTGEQRPADPAPTIILGLLEDEPLQAPSLTVLREQERGDLVHVTLDGLPAHRALDVLLTIPDVGWAVVPRLLPGSEVIRVTLEPCSHLRGRVRDPDGKPCAGASVTASFEDAPPADPLRRTGRDWCTGTTDEEGQFDLRPFGRGRCSVVASSQPHPWSGSSVASTRVTAPTDGPLVELRLAAPAVASGRIVGVDPRRGDEFHIFVALPDGDDTGFPVAETDGFFEVSWPGSVPATLIARNHTDTSDRRVALLEVPKTGGDGLQLVLKPGFTVTGLVVDASGQPAADVTVTIRGRWTRDETTTGADGRFTCLPQPDDALELHARAPDGREVRRAVKPGEVELSLPAR